MTDIPDDIKKAAFHCLAGFTPHQQQANVARALLAEREAAFESGLEAAARLALSMKGVDSFGVKTGNPMRNAGRFAQTIRVALREFRECREAREASFSAVLPSGGVGGSRT